MEGMEAAKLRDLVLLLREEIEEHVRHVKQLQRENSFLVRLAFQLQNQLKQLGQQKRGPDCTTASRSCETKSLGLEEKDSDKCVDDPVFVAGDDERVCEASFLQCSFRETSDNNAASCVDQFASMCVQTPVLRQSLATFSPLSTLMTPKNKSNFSMDCEQGENKVGVLEEQTQPVHCGGVCRGNCLSALGVKLNTPQRVQAESEEPKVAVEDTVYHLGAEFASSKKKATLCPNNDSNTMVNEVDGYKKSGTVIINDSAMNFNQRPAKPCNGKWFASCDVDVHEMASSTFSVDKNASRKKPCHCCGNKRLRRSFSTPGGKVSFLPQSGSDTVAYTLPSLQNVSTAPQSSALSLTAPFRRPAALVDLVDTPSDVFLSRTASRMKGRRQRRRMAVSSCSDAESNSIGQPFGEKVSSNRRKLHVISAGPLPGAKNVLASFSEQRGFRHLSSRGAASAPRLNTRDSPAKAGGWPPSSTPCAENPNQLGVGLDTKGPRDRTWYFHQVLRMAFAALIRNFSDCSNSGGSGDGGGKALVNNAHPTCKSCKGAGVTGAKQKKQEEGQQSCSQHKQSSFYISSDLSKSSGSGSDDNVMCSKTMEKDKSYESSGNCMELQAKVKVLPGYASAQKQTRDAPLEIGVVSCDTSASTIKDLSKETVSLHFRCSKNRPLLETADMPFPPEPIPFHWENDDSELLAAFKTNKHSVRRPREDEISIKFYAPALFAQIRNFLCMDMEGFEASLKNNCVWRLALSPGKSGTSLLYLGNLVLKSVKKTEYDFFLKRFIGSYVRFCERNPDTMLPRFFALLSVSWLQSRVCTWYVLMQNVFSTRYYINRIYDLKGSTVGRSTAAETAPRTTFGALLLKDNDLPVQLIICGPLQRAFLLAQFCSDTAFLCKLNIVDYSCLIGIRSRVFLRKEGPSKTIVLKERIGTSWRPAVTSEAIGVGEERLLGMDMSCIHGCDGGLLSLPIYNEGDDTTAREDVYYIGIIDVLQEYTPAKQFESFLKGLWNGRQGISVVPAKEYAERLNKTLQNIAV